MKGNVAVGDWVRDEMGREWLVIRWNPFSGFFDLEAEDGKKSCEMPEYLEKVS